MTDSDSTVTAAGIQGRAIVARTSGRSHGPIRRLVSPGDVGAMIKPFVFLDLFRLDAKTPANFGMHPHSGIATLTYLVSGEIHFLDRHGNAGSQARGGIEWMMAGGGVWHGSPLTSAASATGFQLWVALPPALEAAAPEELFLTADQVPAVGPARVLLGSYGGVQNPIPFSSPMTYLHVTLAAGERWTFSPPPGHDVAWIALDAGTIAVPDRVAAGELVVFEESARALTISSEHGGSFVLGSAAKHPHPLVTGDYSVHTNAAALAKGEIRIAELGRQLRREGRIG